MWELYRQAKAFRCRPSELVGYVEPIKAFYFDRGVWMFGTEIDNALATADQNAKNPKFARAARARVLANYLRGGESTGRYRDPATEVASPVKEEVVELGDFGA